jgi:predicted restriction endonuclease
LIVTEILETARSKNLANTLWGSDKNGQNWELIFFVKVLGIIEKGKRSFLNELGYSEDDPLMGNRKITDRFLSKYSSVENFLSLNLETAVSSESFSDDIATQAVGNVLPSRLSKEERFEHLKELAQKALQDKSRDFVEVNGKRIKRKTILVAFVKERDNHTCKACGFTFKKKDGESYVEVAHIKPLSEGGPDDPENMVALCANCHKKLDKGDEKARNEVIEALRKNGVNV